MNEERVPPTAEQQIAVIEAALAKDSQIVLSMYQGSVYVCDGKLHSPTLAGCLATKAVELEQAVIVEGGLPSPEPRYCPKDNSPMRDMGNGSYQCFSCNQVVLVRDTPATVDEIWEVLGHISSTLPRRVKAALRTNARTPTPESTS